MRYQKLNPQKLSIYCYQRAIEWCNLPVFIFTRAGALLLMGVPVVGVLFMVVISKMIWSVVAEREANIKIAQFLPFFNYIMPVTCIFSSVVLFMEHKIITATIALLWFQLLPMFMPLTTPLLKKMDIKFPNADYIHELFLIQAEEEKEALKL